MIESKLKKWKFYIILIAFWIIIEVLMYYVIPYFIIPLLWLLICLLLLTLLVRNIFKFFKKIKINFKERFIKVLITTILFFLTFYHIDYYPKTIIEKIDWILLYNKRMETIDLVKNNKLKPNVSWNGFICELPYEYPIISNGGNDIGIFKNKKNNTLTIQFYVFRNFFDSPSTYFIYTEDSDYSKIVEEKIKSDPENNWKLEKNWYRVFGDF